jgi:carboxypeptidase T
MKIQTFGSLRLLATLLFILSASSLSYAHVGSHLEGGHAKIITLKLTEYQSSLRKLISDGYDIAGVDVSNGTADVIVSLDSEIELTSLNLGTVVGTKMVDPTVAPEAGYTTFTELTAILKDYQSRFPGIFSLESIGKSLEGRDIWAVKISDNVAIHENEPAIFFNAMHHAREVMTTEVAIDLMDQLTSQYSKNAHTKNWVDSNEIWVVPMVNPDGNEKVWTSNNMWRKNTRDGYGVDINRNYPYAWASCNGSSASTSSDAYHGASAASEPETQAMMGIVGRIQPSLSISYHSYSELVIFPYGCDQQYTPERETIENLGKSLASRLPKDGSPGTYAVGTAWELLYAVDGGDIDWYYNENNVLPYVIEVNSSAQGFQPAFSWRQRTVEKMRAGWGFMLDRMQQSGIRASVSIEGQRANTGVVIVTPIAGDQRMGAPVRTYKIKSDGSFHVVIDPGMYTVSVSVGDRSTQQDVTVGSRRVDLTVEL